MKSESKVKGLKSRHVFIPTIIIIGFLFISILISTIFIEKITYNITTEMEKTSNIVSKISNVQSNSSKLSETMTSFANNPLLPSNILNKNALDAYYEEYTIEEKKPDNIIKSLKEYGIDEESLEYVTMATDSLKQMMKVQAHVLYLLDSIDEITIDSKYLDIVEKIELTSYEKSMSSDAKFLAANRYIQASDDVLGINYAALKGVLSNNLKEATTIVNQKSNTLINYLGGRLRMLRAILWTSISLILVANIIFFITLLKKCIFPIDRYTKKIDENAHLEETGALYETNLLAKAYNSLLDRHKELEDMLRITAEMDALTNIPNRYSYSNAIKHEIAADKSSCVFLFDINNLKYVNDTYGHAAGDDLIVRSANCIKDCFNFNALNNCYRIGGDEFVAIIDNIKKEDISLYVNRFKEKEKEYEVSIAAGFAYSENVRELGYEKLVMEADKDMYRNKNRIYKNNMKDFK